MRRGLVLLGRMPVSRLKKRVAPDPSNKVEGQAVVTRRPILTPAYRYSMYAARPLAAATALASRSLSSHEMA